VRVRGGGGEGGRGGGGGGGEGRRGHKVSLLGFGHMT